ncbi:MAG: hypothetical protein ACJAVN_001789 [Roseivirga sp.]|jgi:hypothetical protein
MRKVTLIIATVLSLCNLALAQIGIRGTITDEETGMPIEGAHVFVNGTQKGALTDEKGTYHITGVELRSFRLIISFVGYTSKAFDVEGLKGMLTIDGSLEGNAYDLGSVVVNSKRDRRRERNMKRFKEFFFGVNYDAEKIKIENEYGIDITNGRGSRFSIDNAPVLNVNNDHLGYELYFQLQDFELGKRNFYFGYTQFINIQPDSESQAEQWKKNRKGAYLGSMRHFFKALIDDNVLEAGYEANMVTYVNGVELEISWNGKLRKSRPLEPRYSNFDSTRVKDLLEVEKGIYSISKIEDDLYLISFKDILEVDYLKREDENGRSQRSGMKLVEPLMVYSNGLIKNPESIKLMGYWSTLGIYDLLPLDYVPDH